MQHTNFLVSWKYGNLIKKYASVVTNKIKLASSDQARYPCNGGRVTDGD